MQVPRFLCFLICFAGASVAAADVVPPVIPAADGPRCLRLESLPALSSIDLAPDTKACAVFLDGASTSLDLEDIRRRVDSIGRAVALLALGPDVPTPAAASVLLAANVSTVVAQGLMSASRAAAAAWLVVAMQAGKELTCSQRRLQTLVTDSASYVSLKGWAVPVSLTSHFTSHAQVVHFDSLLGFANVGSISDIPISGDAASCDESVSRRRELFIPGDCKEVAPGAEAADSLSSPFRQAAEFLVDRADAIVMSGRSVGTLAAVREMLCVVDTIASPRRIDLSNQEQLSARPSLRPSSLVNGQTQSVVSNARKVVGPALRRLWEFASAILRFLYVSVWKPMSYTMLAMILLILLVIALAITLGIVLKTALRTANHVPMTSDSSYEPSEIFDEEVKGKSSDPKATF